MDRYVHSPTPVVRLGVDFGSDMLVVTCPGQDGNGYRVAEFPGWSQELPCTGSSGPVHGIPVMIHYGQDMTRSIGDEVVHAGCCDHPATARWIRKYLLEDSPVRIQAGTDSLITFRDAASDFLKSVLARAIRECFTSPTIIFTVPADVPDWYTVWLGSIAHATGIASWYTINEYAAVAAGYGLVVGGGQGFIIIRFEETDFTVSVVRSEGSSESSPDGGLCVTGVACEETGCRELDRWIVQDILARNRMRCTGGMGQRIYEGILGRIGEVHTQMATTGEAVLDITDPLSGTARSVRVLPEDISRIIAENGFPALLDRTINRARVAACSRGFGEVPPIAVLMTGRGSALPAVQELVKQRFSDVPVLCDHPCDAAARGAAWYQASVNRPDRIRNDYALRYWDPKGRKYHYRFLVRSGARYPSGGQVARITISAAYDGQSRLGLPLYEISTAPDTHAPALELVSDPAGGIRLAGPAEDARNGSRPLLVNDRTPMLLVAEPPALKGEPRFELTFMIDREKRLCVTARDLLTGTLIKRDAPVHRLT